jgi:hypothetical protein
MYSPMFERMGAVTGLIVTRCSPQHADTTVAEHEAVYRAIARTTRTRRAPRWTRICRRRSDPVGGDAAEKELSRRERQPGAAA